MEEQLRKRKKHRHHKKRRHLGLKIFLSILLLIIIAVSGLAYGIYKNLEGTFNAAYVKGPQTTAVNFSKSQPFTTLLIETGTLNSKNTCLAAVVASTNVSSKQTTFVNFPVNATLPDGTTIDGTYESNGENGLLQTTQNTLGVPINKIVQVDVNKMGELIEATGGIVLQNAKTFVAGGYQFNQGTVNLSTASQVEAYVTQVDANDQNATITRIQNVSMALYNNIQKLTNKSNLTTNINYYRNILSAFSDTVKTDISFSEFKTILLNYNKALRNTSKLNLHADNNVISATEITNVKQLFQKTLK